MPQMLSRIREMLHMNHSWDGVPCPQVMQAVGIEYKVSVATEFVVSTSPGLYCIFNHHCCWGPKPCRSMHKLRSSTAKDEWGMVYDAHFVDMRASPKACPLNRHIRHGIGCLVPRAQQMRLLCRSAEPAVSYDLHWPQRRVFSFEHSRGEVRVVAQRVACTPRARISTHTVEQRSPAHRGTRGSRRRT